MSRAGSYRLSVGLRSADGAAASAFVLPGVHALEVLPSGSDPDAWSVQVGGHHAGWWKPPGQRQADWEPLVAGTSTAVLVRPKRRFVPADTDHYWELLHAIKVRAF